MNYYFSKTAELPIDRAAAATVEALQKNGFGVPTEIDVRQTMKKNLNATLYPWRLPGGHTHPVRLETFRSR